MVKIPDKILNMQPLAEGGEAFLYDYGEDVLKIYKSNVDLKQKKKKIEKFVSVSLPKNVIKPKELAFNGSGNFIG